MKRSRIFLGFVLLVGGLAVSATAWSAPRQGISIGFGLGTGFGSSDAGGVAEAQLAYDLGPARLGLHLGQIYTATHGGDSYDLRRGTHEYEEETGGELMFTPLELDVCFMPLRFINRGNMAFQPYVGLGMGTIDTGGGIYEGYKLSISSVVRAGIDFYLGEWTVLGLEYAQHQVKNDTDNRDLSYNTVMLQFRFRIPIVRRHLVSASGGATDLTAVETKSAPTMQPAAKPKRIKDGEPAIIATALEPSAATTKIKAYFDNKDLDYTVNPDNGRITSDWFDERRCGPGFQKCANKATVRVTAEEGKTMIRVQVVERKREAGLVDRPWNENSTSKGEATAKLAAELEVVLTATTTQ